MPSPTLCWYDNVVNGRIISEAQAQKEVWLVAHNSQVSDPFNIRRRNFLTGFLPGRVGSHRVASVPTEMRSDRLVSSDPWLATGCGVFRLKGSAVYYFNDNQGNRSGELAVTRLANVSFHTIQAKRGSGGVRTKGALDWWAPIQVHVDVSNDSITYIDGTVTAPADPRISLKLLEPRTDLDELTGLITSAEEIFREAGDPPGESYMNLAEPWLKPAGDFTLEIDTGAFEVNPGEPKSFSVMIRAYQPTQFIFALKAEDLDNPGLFCFSDVLAVSVVP